MRPIKVLFKKDCSNCEKLMPELKELSKELPMEFIEANSLKGESEVEKTGLPQIVLPLVNVNDKDFIMGFHKNIRGKILRSSIENEKIIHRRIMLEKNWQEDEKICSQDIIMDLKTGDVKKEPKKCWVVRK